MELSLALQALRLEPGATAAEVEAAYRRLLGQLNIELQAAPPSENGRLGGMLYALKEAYRVALASAPPASDSEDAESFESCVDSLRSEDRDVRMAAVQRIAGFDDPRVLKVLEALVNDPDPELARRARDEMILRTGEAIAQKNAAPNLGHIGVFGSFAAAARMLAQYPGPLFKVAAFNALAVGLLSSVLAAGLMLLGLGIGLIVTAVAHDSKLTYVIVFPIICAGGGLIALQLPSFSSGLLAWAIGRIYQGDRITLADALTFVRTRVGPLLRTSCQRSWLLSRPLVLAGLGVGFCYFARWEVPAVPVMLAGGIGVIMALLRYLLADVACVIEGLGGQAACERSRSLWFKHSGSIFGYLALIACIQLANQAIVGLLEIRSFPGLVACFAWGVILGTWMVLAQVVLFYDLCARERLERAG